jgi:Tfp pilus assembly protein PilN
MRAVNLIPVEQRSGQPVGAGRSQGGAYAVLLVVGGLALMAYLYGEARHQISSRRGQAAALTAQARQTQAAAERLAPYTSFIALREERKQDVDALIDSRFDWAHVLHEFGRVLPAQTSISSLSGTVGATSTETASTSSSATPSTGASASAVASATPSGSVPTFTLAGCAINQPAVALMLERLHLIDGVNEVTLQSSTAGSSTGSTSGGGCSGHDASFTASVTFDPLPSTSAVAAASKSETVSSSTPTTSGASTK